MSADASPTTMQCSRPSGGRTPAARPAACAPGGCVVFVGGCKADSDASLPTRPLHYDELDLHRAFHQRPTRSTARSPCWPRQA